MFDELFKTDTKTEIKTPTTPKESSGMFDDVFVTKQKQTPITTPIIQPSVTPTVAIPKKNTFLNTLKSMFFVTNPLKSGFIPQSSSDIIDQKIVQPVLDRTANTQIGKDIITTTEKSTRGSSLLKAVPEAIYKQSKDILSGVKTEKDIVDYYGEAVSDWEKGGQDPAMGFAEKTARGVLDSGVQSTVGVLLNLIPFVGKPASMAYYSTLSASEQINERGQVNSLGNIGIDVAGDMILGNMFSGYIISLFLFINPVSCFI